MMSRTNTTLAAGKLTAGLLSLAFIGLNQPLHAIDGAFLVAESNYTQEPGRAPVLEPGYDAYNFAVFLDGALPEAVNSATLSIPGGGIYGIDYSEMDEVDIGDSFLSFPDLQAGAPSGRYTLDVDYDGTVGDLDFDFPGVDLPPAPNISNLTALQSAPQSGTVTITWNAWTGANAETDRIGIYIWSTEPPLRRLLRTQPAR